MRTTDNSINQRLESLLRKMDIPPNRKHLSLSNLMWLTRNLGIRNSEHPDYNETYSLIKECIKTKNYTH